MTIALASKWRAERTVAKLAYFDSLTGLPNREQSRNRLVGAIEVAKLHERTLAVLYLDLDNFKRVNDTLGHAVGDELLRVVASRLRSTLRYGDRGIDSSSISRPGIWRGWVVMSSMVLLPNIRKPADAGVIAERSSRTAGTDAAGAQFAGGHTSVGSRYPQRWKRCRNVAAQCRSGDVLLQAQDAGNLFILRCRDERQRAAAFHHRRQVAPARWLETSSPSTTSRCSTFAPATSPAWKHCCAGPMTSSALCRRRNLSR